MTRVKQKSKRIGVIGQPGDTVRVPHLGQIGTIVNVLPCDAYAVRLGPGLATIFFASEIVRVPIQR